METEEGYQPVFFDPRPLTNLELLDRLESLAPILDMKVGGVVGSREGGSVGQAGGIVAGLWA